MSSPAVTVHPGATLAEAARSMARKQVKRLPVVNDIGLLEGVVGRSDLLTVFLRTDAELRRRSVDRCWKSSSPACPWRWTCRTARSPRAGRCGATHWCPCRHGRSARAGS
ncbi:CBS domain-containing protein [Streptomyces sp. NPDC101132]|uniref:CBS domain-containing protein n=1 Tax=Streptomyces sp. NPDC101132 TaxID=3366110 RepID=UPI0038111659